MTANTPSMRERFMMRQYNHERLRCRSCVANTATSGPRAYLVAAATRTPGNRLSSCSDANRASSCCFAATSGRGSNASGNLPQPERTFGKTRGMNRSANFQLRARHARTRPPRGKPSASACVGVAAWRIPTEVRPTRSPDRARSQWVSARLSAHPVNRRDPSVQRPTTASQRVSGHRSGIRDAVMPTQLHIRRG